MEKANPRPIWFILIFLIFISLITFYYMSLRPENSPLRSQVNKIESSPDSFTTITDAEGNIVLQTGLPVNIDDEYINENNQHFVITKVAGRDASAIIKDDQESLPSLPQSNLLKTYLSIFSPNKTLPVQADRNIHVVVYHTHTDESFIPTAKTASQPGKGGIYQVGERFTDSLRRSGISVTHSLAKHDPHNIHAYNRSRRTLVQLLKEQPDAAFDIHRDAAPTSAYLTTINGVLSSRAMIVIGRSNPHMNTNLQYAKKVKDQADQIYPGLMRGIYMGRGSYNQDLYPTALLFEIGTASISQDLAEKTATCLADILSNTLGQ